MENFICKDCGADYSAQQEKERCPKCEKAREKWIGNKIGQLNDYIIEELNMELQDNRISTVKENVKGWEKAIKSEEFKKDDHTGDLEIIEELKKFIGYNCLYAIDTEHPILGQGYVIVDKDLNYVDFVKTI